MNTKRKISKPALKQPMSGGTGTKPITGPLDPRRLLQSAVVKRLRKKLAK